MADSDSTIEVGRGHETHPARLGRPMRTALYRHFDAEGGLLYVGISASALARLAQHQQTASWCDLITRVTVEWHGSRQDAMQAERVAIRQEKPQHNIVRPAPTPDQTLRIRATITPHAKRPRGRPFLSPDEARTMRADARVTPEQHAKFQRLGGPTWLRRQIDRAKEPGTVYAPAQPGDKPGDEVWVKTGSGAPF